jgi:hypothetical protein
MNKDYIIKTIENLPTNINGYTLYIYEVRSLESWGLICTKGQLNKKKLLDIFDNNNEIKHYYFDNNLEFQFAVDYVKNEEELLFGETNTGSLPDSLTTVMTKISEYKK